MSNAKKFIIYYQPAKLHFEYMKSLTLIISRFENNDNIYKKKLLLEHKSKERKTVEEYKMREVHTNANEIIEKISKIDFSKKYTKPVKDLTHDYFLIQYGDEKIETSNESEIAYILEMFNFNDLISITHKHYKYIKDMDEYTELVKILNSKVPYMSRDNLLKICSEFKNADPYSIFQEMIYY